MLRPPAHPGIRILLLGILVLVSTSLHADSGSGMARQLLASGTILPLQHFIDQARALRPGKLIDADLHPKLEHHGYVYEIHMVDPGGLVWEVEFDAVTGELLEIDEPDQ